MRAILVYTGQLKNIFALEVRGECEIQSFFQRNKGNYRANIGGLIKCYQTIADERGFNIPDQWFKCWRADEELLCQITKGRLRICCFQYDEGLLLATIFVKRSDIQPEEYDRALRLKTRFDENQSWEVG